MRLRLLLLGLIFLTACGSGSSTPTSLRVGTSGDYAPLTFVEGGQLKGVEIDFANELAKETGRKLELVQMPFVELIPALEGGKIDVIMSGMSVTSERKEKVEFTDPYLQ